MAYEKELPEWGAKGIQPPESKRAKGWEVEDRPPADWLNWQMNRTYEALKEVQEKAAEKKNVQAAKITRDDGTAQLAPDRDINNWYKLGVYSFNEAHVSTPSGFVRGLIFVYEDAEGVTYQMAWETDSRLAVRTKNEVGRWTEWGGMGASDDLEKILAGYMPKTGGTFTGNVGFPGAETSNLYFLKGTGDNATYETYNNAIQAHWGLAMKTHNGTVTGLWDSRIGRWVTKGGYVVQNNSGVQWIVDGDGNQSMNGLLKANSQLHVAGKAWLGKTTLFGAEPSLTVTIGDTDTGFNWVGDGQFDIMANNLAAAKVNGGQMSFRMADGSYKTANDLFQSGVEAKNRIAGAINAKGVPASASDDFPTLAWKIGQITTGVPMARITTSVSEGVKQFFISEDSQTAWGFYYIIVTGLSFQAKGIVVLDEAFRALAAFDLITKAGISVSGASYNHQVVYRDTLPLNEWSILATITPNSFIVPVTRYESDSNRPAKVIVYG